MNKYSYKGPVLEFEKIVANNWSGSTLAVSEKKARCNLAHRFKTETGRTAQCKITLPGKIVMVEERDDM